MEANKTVSVSYAIVRGLLYVNGPVLLFTFGPMLTLLWLQPTWLDEHIPKGFAAGAFALGLFSVSLAAAWGWWSFAVPRWRIWTYERVTNISHLKTRVVRVGLTWPDDHLFAKTEFKSIAQAQCEHELELVQKTRRQ